MAFRSWLASSLVRHFPQTPASTSSSLVLDGARNEQLSFQVAVRLESTGSQPRTVRIEVEADKALNTRVRRVGYVPVRHHNTATSESELDGVGHIPGYVPDPLFPEDSLLLPTNETHAFWVSLRPAPSAVAGNYRVTVKVTAGDEKPVLHTVKVHLHDVLLQKRRDFSVTHWFYIDALLDYYRTDHFDERFWTLTERYMRNMVEHGLDTILVPVFTPPLDGVKRPTQLLGVTRRKDGEYVFDWSDVKKYVDLARRAGFSKFEWSHFFTQWGAAHAIRIYEGQGQDENLLWQPETSATSETYRAFLAQFLPGLHSFLRQEKLLKKSYFHVSDEPHGEEHRARYIEARGLLRELAPWMKVIDALSDVEFGRGALTDLPVASIHTALDFVREDIDCWAYHCCFPRGDFLNRLLDTPLPKIAMHGFLLYRWPFGGFLHWGYNYWYRQGTRTLIDPLCVQDGGAWPNWAFGDTFVVYPGEDGPIDSIRWEIFAESLQDYALLQTVGIERGAKLLAELKSFEDFPKNEAWRRAARRQLLRSS